MEHYERSQIEALLDRDAELATLWQEHQVLKNRIQELESLPHMTPGEQRECKQLRKQKLAGKDQMVQIVARLEHA